MASTKDPDRVLLGRLGAYTVHNQYDSREQTKPARKAFESKFERDVCRWGAAARGAPATSRDGAQGALRAAGDAERDHHIENRRSTDFEQRYLRTFDDVDVHDF